VYKKFTHKLITVQAIAVIANDAVAENGCVLYFFIFRPFPLVTASLAVNNAAAVIAPEFDIIHIYI
jgi:cytochrome b subunit of formate dehydrogenase